MPVERSLRFTVPKTNTSFVVVLRLSFRIEQTLDCLDRKRQTETHLDILQILLCKILFLLTFVRVNS